MKEVLLAVGFYCVAFLILDFVYIRFSSRNIFFSRIYMAYKFKKYNGKPFFRTLYSFCKIFGFSSYYGAKFDPMLCDIVLAKINQCNGKLKYGNNIVSNYSDLKFDTFTYDIDNGTVTSEGLKTKVMLPPQDYLKLKKQRKLDVIEHRRKSNEELRKKLL